jgi:hypothetical protein
MYLEDDWIDFVDVQVTGAARDEVTDAAGSTTMVDESSVRLETKGGLLTTAEIAPPELDADELIGHPLRMGFRRRVRDLHEPGGRTLGLLRRPCSRYERRRTPSRGTSAPLQPTPWASSSGNRSRAFGRRCPRRSRASRAAPT